MCLGLLFKEFRGFKGFKGFKGFNVLGVLIQLLTFYKLLCTDRPSLRDLLYRDFRLRYR